MKYIAKKDAWFDEGTEVKLLCEPFFMGVLAEGFRNGKIDEELCGMDEFEIIEETEKLK